MTSISKHEDSEIKVCQLIENIHAIQKNEKLPFAVNCSVGIAVATKGKEELPQLYKKADTALYTAKHNGKNGYEFYERIDKQTILIVDDIEVNRVVIKIALEANYSILEAEDGTSALAIMEKHPDISLIITDIQMPKMDGLELIKQVRSNSAFANISIIANTQYGDSDLEKKAYEFGVNDFIYKESLPNSIQLRINNVLKARDNR